jgi:hypothetical protein
MKNKREKEKDTTDDAVLLEDLRPREDVRGGSGKIRFGQEAAARPPHPPSDPKKRRG